MNLFKSQVEIKSILERIASQLATPPVQSSARPPAQSSARPPAQSSARPPAQSSARPKPVKASSGISSRWNLPKLSIAPENGVPRITRSPVSLTKEDEEILNTAYQQSRSITRFANKLMKHLFAERESLLTHMSRLPEHVTLEPWTRIL